MEETNHTPEPLIPKEVEAPEVETKSPDKRKPLLIFIALLTIILTVGSGLIVFILNRNKANNNVPNEVDIVELSKEKLFIDCADIREVLEEENTLYVGCLGGVIIFDKSKNETIKEISGPQGLSNSTVTSIEKKGDILYIGTQDGFFEYQVVSGAMKHISVKEGLVNGSNIILALDGDILWVGTFDGVSKYNTVDKSITNYTSELMSGSTKWSINDLLVTEKSIYAIVLANAYSGGGVARLDKASGKWQAFPVSSFGVGGQYPRVDLSSLVAVNDTVYVNDYAKFWYRTDDDESKWTSDVKLSQEIKALNLQSPYPRIVGENKNALYLYIANKLYQYAPTQKLKEISFSGNFTSMDAVISGGKSIDKLWIHPVEMWLKWFNLDSLESGEVNLDRPFNISSLLLLIDQNPIVASSNKVYRYDIKKDEFQALFDISFDSNFGNLFFQPIPGSQDVVIYSQSCGQGCTEPELNIYNYKDNNLKEIEIDSRVLNAIKFNSSGFSSFSALTLDEFDINKKTFNFVYTENKLAIYDYNVNAWELKDYEKTMSADGTILDARVCAYSYGFGDNEDKFNDPGCSSTVQNEKHKWFIREKGVVQVDNTTKLEEILTPPTATKSYSPFDWETEYAPNQLQLFGDTLYVSSNLGLAAYDTNTSEWTLIDTFKGLSSNDVTNFIPGKNYIWAKTNWGGLSGIPK